VVSTNTINLQEQLVGKDLPLLRDALSTEQHTPTFALLKGWRNYLCLSRLHAAIGASDHCSSRTSTTRSAALPSGRVTLPTAPWPT
jgi:ATP-dependent DNA helicase DinG